MDFTKLILLIYRYYIITFRQPTIEAGEREDILYAASRQLENKLDQDIDTIQVEHYQHDNDVKRHDHNR